MVDSMTLILSSGLTLAIANDLRGRMHIRWTLAGIACVVGLGLWLGAVIAEVIR